MEYSKVIISIIEAQENIIGPVAIERATHVEGLAIDWSNKAVQISGEPMGVLADLVGQYRELFGDISVEVCREAAMHSVGSGALDKLPAMLR